MATLRLDKATLLTAIDKALVEERRIRDAKVAAHAKAVETYSVRLARALTDAAKRAKAGELPRVKEGEYDGRKYALTRFIAAPELPVLGIDLTEELQGESYRRMVELSAGDTFTLADTWPTAGLIRYLGLPLN
jgi:hypothetical protein